MFPHHVQKNKPTVSSTPLSCAGLSILAASWRTNFRDSLPSCSLAIRSLAFFTSACPFSPVTSRLSLSNYLFSLFFSFNRSRAVPFPASTYLSSDWAAPHMQALVLAQAPEVLLLPTWWSAGQWSPVVHSCSLVLMSREGNSHYFIAISRLLFRFIIGVLSNRRWITAPISSRRQREILCVRLSMVLNTFCGPTFHVCRAIFIRSQVE